MMRRLAVSPLMVLPSLPGGRAMIWLLIGGLSWMRVWVVPWRWMSLCRGGLVWSMVLILLNIHIDWRRALLTMRVVVLGCIVAYQMALAAAIVVLPICLPLQTTMRLFLSRRNFVW